MLRGWRLPAIRNKIGRGSRNVRVRLQGLSLKRMVDTWSWARQSAKITAWHRNYLVLEIFISRPSIWLNTGPTLSVIRMFAPNFLRACLGAPESVSARKEDMPFFFSPTVFAWLWLTPLKACDWSGHIFRASASPRSLTKKCLRCPLPLSLTVISVCEIRVAVSCGIRVLRNWGEYPSSSS